MITYYVLLFLAGVLLGITSPLRLLPDVVLPDQIASAIANISSFVGLVWKLFPITLLALVGAIATIVVVENWVMIYKVIRWVYQKIPGIN